MRGDVQIGTFDGADIYLPDNSTGSFLATKSCGIDPNSQDFHVVTMNIVNASSPGPGNQVVMGSVNIAYDATVVKVDQTEFSVSQFHEMLY